MTQQADTPDVTKTERGKRPDPRHRLGEEAEAQAERHLRSLGWRIVARRWRCRLGELDLVGVDGDTIVFVEVRCRSETRHGRPEETVGPLKQRRLTALARAWLAGRPEAVRLPCRFDVVAVTTGPGGTPQLSHFRDAFRAR